MYPLLHTPPLFHDSGVCFLLFHLGCLFFVFLFAGNGQNRGVVIANAPPKMIPGRQYHKITLDNICNNQFLAKLIEVAQRKRVSLFLAVLMCFLPSLLFPFLLC